MPEPPDSPLKSADLLPLVYRQLRSLAAAYMRRERPGHTLQPTALVHEAYIALAGSERAEWHSKTHFMATAAVQMRRVLVDHARRRNARRRPGRWEHIQLDEGIAINEGEPIDLLALDAALDRLAEYSPRQSLVLEYRVFGGLSEKEIARLLDVSERTVRNDWKTGRARLVRALSRQ